MGQRPDEIREDIERTRGDLSRSLDVLGDRVSPRQVAQRRVSGMRGRLASMRQTVMGSADGGGVRGAMSGIGTGAGQPGGDAAGTVTDQLRDAPDAMRQNVEGNPLAAGFIAFGAGLLLGSIIPSTETEQRMASTIAEGMQPVIEQAKDTASELASGLEDSARQAVAELKDGAAGAVEEIKDEATGSADEIKREAAGAAHDMRNEAQNAAQQVTSSTGRSG